jgi:hypothetical protein
VLFSEFDNRRRRSFAEEALCLECMIMYDEHMVVTILRRSFPDFDYPPPGMGGVRL